MTDKEYWLPLYLDNMITKYKISTYGNIINSKTGQLIKLTLNPSGYYYVHLYHNHKEYTLAVHRLVARTFMPVHLVSAPVVNHIDGDKTNNNIDNLEWTSSSGNLQHAYNIGLKKKMYGEKHGKAIYTDELVHKICSLMENGCQNKEIATTLNIPFNISFKNLAASLRSGTGWQPISSLYKIPQSSVGIYDNDFIEKICVLLSKKRTAAEIREILKLPTTTEYIALITGIKQRKRYRYISEKYEW